MVKIGRDGIRLEVPKRGAPQTSEPMNTTIPPPMLQPVLRA